jgi:hypothetical protein
MPVQATGVRNCDAVCVAAEISKEMLRRSAHWQRQQRDHSRRRSRGRQDQHVSAWSCASACVAPTSMSSHTVSFLRKRVQLARPCRNLEHRLHLTGTQILVDRVARQARPSLDLPDRHPLTKMPPPDYTQESCPEHVEWAIVIAPMSSSRQARRTIKSMGHFSFKTYAPLGSAHSNSRHLTAILPCCATFSVYAI